MKPHYFTGLTFGIALACLSGAVALAQPAANSAKWVSFNDCPVLLEQRFVVPARDSGIVESLAVELNDAVEQGQLLLNLEKQTAETDLQSARLLHAIDVDGATDQSELNLRKLALKQADEELTSYSEISKSVSASELRRLKLTVASATVAVTNAENALKRMDLKAKLSAKAVDSAALKLANRDVHAPSAGIVTELYVRPGQWIDAGKPVMVISDLRQLQVDCLIPIEKLDLKRLIGLEVRVESNHRTAAGKPIRATGKITSYDPKLNAHGEVRVHCRIQNVQEGGHWQLLPEMNCRLEVAVPAGESPALITRRPNTP